MNPRLTQPGNEPLPPGNHTATSALAVCPLGLPLGLAGKLLEAWGTEDRYLGSVGPKERELRGWGSGMASGGSMTACRVDARLCVHPLVWAEGAQLPPDSQKGDPPPRIKKPCSRVCPHPVSGAPFSEPAFYQAHSALGTRPGGRCEEVLVHEAPREQCGSRDPPPSPSPRGRYFLSSHHMSPKPPDTGCEGWGRSSTHFPSVGRAWSPREVHSLAQ